MMHAMRLQLKHYTKYVARLQSKHRYPGLKRRSASGCRAQSTSSVRPSCREWGLEGLLLQVREYVPSKLWVPLPSGQPCQLVTA